jgi:hypothetical protein
MAFVAMPSLSVEIRLAAATVSNELLVAWDVHYVGQDAFDTSRFKPGWFDGLARSMTAYIASDMGSTQRRGATMKARDADASN